MKYHKRFSKSEVRGILLLLAIIATICAIRFWGPSINEDKSVFKPSDSEANTLREFALRTQQQKKSYQKKSDDHRADSTMSQSYAATPFDPNSASEVQMTRAGLKPWQARNVIKYREKGGIWRSKAHFRKLYGLTAEEYERIAPLLLLPDEHIISYHHKEDYTKEGKASTDNETPRKIYPKQEKFSPGTTIDINTADTTLLKHIPGIGSYYAQKICKYRERLGGFVSTQQMDEIEGLPSDIKTWVTITSQFSPQKIYINRATFQELIRHPYLSYEQTKAIVNYRNKYGPISSFKTLSLDKNFTESDFSRLNPYIDFSK
jgi:DNA uptake protein ComE-like DNA-binding protein